MRANIVFSAPGLVDDHVSTTAVAIAIAILYRHHKKNATAITKNKQLMGDLQTSPSSSSSFSSSNLLCVVQANGFYTCSIVRHLCSLIYLGDVRALSATHTTQQRQPTQGSKYLSLTLHLLSPPKSSFIIQMAPVVGQLT